MRGQPPSVICTGHGLPLLLNEHILRYCAPFLANGSFGLEGEQYGEDQAYGVGEKGPSKQMDLPEESLNGEASRQMRSMESPEEDKIPPQSATVQAVHYPGISRFNHSNTNKTQCRQQRIRVGFLSAFFYHHSVGLLVEGVMTRLDRRRFETTAIFLQPHPTSSTEQKGGSDGDDVYNSIRARTEHVLDVSANRYVVERV